MILQTAKARKRGEKPRRPKGWPALVLIVFLGAALHPVALHAAGPRIAHVVVIWLKRPGNVRDERALIRASKEFERIRGVIRVEAGPGLAVGRPGIDQSFDVGVVMIFKNRKAMKRFADDPRHLLAVRTVLKPTAARYIVYNFPIE
jgi:Stress responsive A/B Barrel Domain